MAAKKQIMPKKIGSVSKKQVLPKKIGSVTKKQNLPLTGADAIKKYQYEISPKGMAGTKAKQTAALDKLMEKRYGKKK